MRAWPSATRMPPAGAGPVTTTSGGSPASVKRPGTGSASSPQGSASSPAAYAATNGSPEWSDFFHASVASALAMAASNACSGVSASTVTVAVR